VLGSSVRLGTSCLKLARSLDYNLTSQWEGLSHFLLYVDDKINILTRSTHDEDSPYHLGWSTSLAPGSDTGKWRIFLLIAQTLGRGAGRGKKDENRGENEGKPTSLFTTFKAIWQKARHHRTKLSFRQSLFLGKSTGRIHPFMQSVSSPMVPLSNESMAADSLQCYLVPSWFRSCCCWHANHFKDSFLYTSGRRAWTR
jgi:hypothetical protein